MNIPYTPPIFGPLSQLAFGGALVGDSGGNPTTEDLAIFTYIGRVNRPTKVRFVEFNVTVVGTGAQVAEVGLFSTPVAGGCSAGQTLTKLVADGTLDSLLVGIGVKRNTTGFSGGGGYSVPAGTHLWAGLRTAMGGTEPTVPRIFHDMEQGFTLQKATAGALTASGSFVGSLLAFGAQPPLLRIRL